MIQSWTVSLAMEGLRVDVFLKRKLGELCSRGYLKALIEQGLASVDGRRADPDTAVRSGGRVELDYREPGGPTLQPEAIPLAVVYEDDDLLVVNKPAGMVVHPAKGNWTHTLAHALLHHAGGVLSTVGGALRPGIVHRLDKDSSGLLVVAKNDRAHRFLARQFEARRVERTYSVFVKGEVPHDEGRIDDPLGRGSVRRKKVVVRTQGREAITHYEVRSRFRGATELVVHLETGRTHQIRAHFAHRGHPVLGDRAYGGSLALISRPAVHARRLGFLHPGSRKKMAFEVPLPVDLKELRQKLEALGPG